MREYRTPLPAMLAGLLEAALNRVLRLDPSSEERLLRLQGKCLQLDLEGLEITLFMTFESGNMLVGLDSEAEPDTTISGTPMALFAMAAPDEAGQWGLPGSNVSISGDANLARDIERLFSRMDPNWHEPFTDIFGDTAGFQVASGIEQGAAAAGKVFRDTVEMAGNFLRDESGLVADKEEISSFGSEVDSVSDAVDRLEARIRAIREARD